MSIIRLEGIYRFGRIFALMGFVLLVVFPVSGIAQEDTLHSVKFKVNGEPAAVTVQDLSGLVTRPLRLLIKRNNKLHDENFMNVFATGVREGDALEAEISSPLAGVRVTVYQLLCAKDGTRYLSMPASIYFSEPGQAPYRERIGPAKEEFLILVFEKTDSPGEKNIQIRYFEERMRKLVIDSYKTNLFLSSLKFKLKDFGGDGAGEFFERDAQLLVDRFIHPQQIVMVRLWRKKE